MQPELLCKDEGSGGATGGESRAGGRCSVMWGGGGGGVAWTWEQNVPGIWRWWNEESEWQRKMKKDKFHPTFPELSHVFSFHPSSCYWLNVLFSGCNKTQPTKLATPPSQNHGRFSVSFFFFFFLVLFELSPIIKLWFKTLSQSDAWLV